MRMTSQEVRGLATSMQSHVPYSSSNSLECDALPFQMDKPLESYGDLCLLDMLERRSRLLLEIARTYVREVRVDGCSCKERRRGNSSERPVFRCVVEDCLTVKQYTPIESPVAGLSSPLSLCFFLVLLGVTKVVRRFTRFKYSNFPLKTNLQ